MRGGRVSLAARAAGGRGKRETRPLRKSDARKRARSEGPDARNAHFEVSEAKARKSCRARFRWRARVLERRSRRVQRVQISWAGAARKTTVLAQSW